MTRQGLYALARRESELRGAVENGAEHSDLLYEPERNISLPRTPSYATLSIIPISGTYFMAECSAAILMLIPMISTELFFLCLILVQALDTYLITIWDI